MPGNLPDIVNYYQEYKTALFSTSLTLGTFLFAMKSFIIQTMKRDVYDKSLYQEKVLRRKKEGKTNETFYGPLNNLKRVLFWAITASFLNSLIQLTLGSIKKA